MSFEKPMRNEKIKFTMIGASFGLILGILSLISLLKDYFPWYFFVSFFPTIISYELQNFSVFLNCTSEAVIHALIIPLNVVFYSLLFSFLGRFYKNKKVFWRLVFSYILFTIVIIGFMYLFQPYAQPPRDKTLSILDADCVDGFITLVLANDGVENIDDKDIIVKIDSIDESMNFVFKPNTIKPHSTALAESTVFKTGVHQIIVTTDDSVRGAEVNCG